MQNVAAAGLIPGTPEYQAFMKQAILAPKVVGVPNAAGGTDYIDMNGQPPQQPMPRAGDVQDGYTFLGGDPSNPASWRKQ